MPDPTVASGRRDLARAAGWSVVGLGAVGLTRLAYSALVGRTAGAGPLGEVNSVVSLAFLLTFATAGAVGQAATRFVAEDRGAGGARVAAVRRRLAVVAAVSTTVVAFALIPLGRWVVPGAQDDRSRVVAAVALTLAYGGYTYLKALLYGYQFARFYAVLEVVADAVSLLATVAVVLFDSPAWLLAPLVAGYLTFCGLALVGLRTRPAGPRQPLPLAYRRSINRYIAWTSLGMLASQGFFQACMVVAGHTLPPAGAGQYAAAMTAVTPAFFLPRALSLAFFPSAARAAGTGDTTGVGRQTGVLTRALAILALPAFVVAMALAGPVLRLLFGPGFEPAAPVFQLLAAASYLYVIAVPSVNALSARGGVDVRIPPLASAAGALVGALVLVAAHRAGLGAPGIALGYLAGVTLQAGVPLVLGRSRVGWGFGADATPLITASVIGSAAVAISAAAGQVAGAVAAAIFLLVYGYLFRRRLPELLHVV